MKAMNVCVFGASNNKIPSVYVDFAERFGARLAEEGLGLVFGAGRTGLMGAAARGAYSKAGRIIGVIPKKLNVPGIYFEHCTERIETETMHERKALMEDLSDAFVALSGGFGTLEELLEVITLKQLNYHSKPIVIVNVNGYYDPLLSQFRRCTDEGFTDPLFLNLFTVASDVEEAIDALLHPRQLSMPDKIESVLLSSRFGGEVPPDTFLGK
jgi:TIGR00730 family protein